MPGTERIILLDGKGGGSDRLMLRELPGWLRSPALLPKYCMAVATPTPARVAEPGEV